MVGGREGEEGRETGGGKEWEREVRRYRGEGEGWGGGWGRGDGEGRREKEKERDIARH